MTRFRNSASGAIAALLDLSTFTKTAQTTATRDHQHEGVWLVEHIESEHGEKSRAIVYLAGFEGRSEDDFESEEIT